MTYKLHLQLAVGLCSILPCTHHTNTHILHCVFLIYTMYQCDNVPNNVKGVSGIFPTENYHPNLQLYGAFKNPIYTCLASKSGQT